MWSYQFHITRWPDLGRTATRALRTAQRHERKHAIAQAMMRLLPLLAVAHAARTVKWEVKTTGRAPAPASFGKWFADAKNPVERCIVAANDAISEVSDLGGGNYEGRISGATFPLVKLQPVRTVWK